jgi:hypothetical protein
MVVTDTQIQHTETLCEAFGLIHDALEALYYVWGLHAVPTVGAEICESASHLGQSIHVLARDDIPLANALADVQGHLMDIGRMLQLPAIPNEEDEEDAP